MSWLGIDIGGANLKVADGRGWARSVPFALWRNPKGLTGALAALVESAARADRLAVTMTGELCDCFTSKAEGVRHILAAVEKATGGRDALVYLVDGRLVSIAEARELPHLAAASNWHALARFVCRYVRSGAGLLIDVGSTTTDIIPIVDGQVASRGRSDTERLQSHELLYRAVGRTPICAVVNSLPLGDAECSIAAEVFATTADAYVLLGDLNEDPHADWTADGRPLTKEHAWQRLARQLCSDAADIRPDDFVRMAKAVWVAQCGELSRNIDLVHERMPQSAGTCIVSGTGEFLARAAVKGTLGEGELVSVAEQIGLKASQCAPSHAIAALAIEAERGG